MYFETHNPKKKSIGFEGLHRLPKENLAFSSVFQVCFCVKFLYLPSILIFLIILTFL